MFLGLLFPVVHCVEAQTSISDGNGVSIITTGDNSPVSIVIDGEVIEEVELERDTILNFSACLASLDDYLLQLQSDMESVYAIVSEQNRKAIAAVTEAEQYVEVAAQRRAAQYLVDQSEIFTAMLRSSVFNNVVPVEIRASLLQYYQIDDVDQIWQNRFVSTICINRMDCAARKAIDNMVGRVTSTFQQFEDDLGATAEFVTYEIDLFERDFVGLVRAERVGTCRDLSIN